ncbi:MAG TPA: alkaline phosphatase PafA [Chitinophagaceae bacterium]|jgi:predicted AlkP superfamily pyrophosphatase or phosphodiesterase|nr:alkaline phosphatase PafA [Chitinophagaceae bacterium]
MKTFLAAILSIGVITACAQSVQRPKLIVGIVVDQMRWDFLYRYKDRYAPNGGFNRMLNGGFSCENTLIPYAPTVTACGHSSIYTGSVPAINGITGNGWFDNDLNKSVYCTEDASVQTVGGPNNEGGQMSPRNLLVTTIGDELRLATNFKSKVIGIAIKDRGGILPAGHSANAAYWYNSGTGDWITSTYYMTELPAWVKNFNNQKLADKYFAQGWNTLYPINTYTQSSGDVKPYESKTLGNGFPYDLKTNIGKNYGVIPATPFGNTLTFELAKEALKNEGLGADAHTDLLALSFSSPDYIGHSFGPNSIEQEDDFLRLDKELGEFFDLLDTRLGKGQYLAFLSADHGVAHVPGFLNENKIPAELVPTKKTLDTLNSILKQSFGRDKLVIGIINHQVQLDHRQISSAKLDEQGIKKAVMNYLSKQPEVSRVFETDKVMQTTLNSKIREMMVNGYYPRRSGDIQVMLQPHYIESYGGTGTTHGSWNPYDAHIPLVWYGWKVKQGKTNRETYMTDIAPTISAMLRIQMPSGNVGHVIEELIAE